MAGIFDGAEIISQYTRAQAIADGVLADASTGELAEVTRQHYKYPVAMTAAVWGMIDQAVKNPRWLNDAKGVWHDILYMSRRGVVREIDETTVLFRVIITGVSRSRYHTLKIVCGPGDDAEPVLTVMRPDED